MEPINIYTRRNAYEGLQPLFMQELRSIAYTHKPPENPIEKKIKPNCAFDKQLTKVDETLITLRPNNSFEICQKEEWVFPEISFTVKELRKYFEQRLGECWLIGGAA